MQTTNEILTTGPVAAGLLTPDVRNTLPTLSKTVKSAKPVYYVDDAFLSGEMVEVNYSLNGKWSDISLELQALVNHVANTGMNEYCLDSSDHTGAHVQDNGTLCADTYTIENLSFVVGLI